MPYAEWADIESMIANFPTKKDSKSPAYIEERMAASRPRGARGRVVRPVIKEISEEDAHLNRLDQNNHSSTINPLAAEIHEFVKRARRIPVEERDTLEFWKMWPSKFPNLSRVAKRVLCSSATSCDVERLFSRAGLICTSLRNRLKPRTILFLTALHYHYMIEENLNFSNKRSEVTASNTYPFFPLTFLICRADSTGGKNTFCRCILFR